MTYRIGQALWYVPAAEPWNTACSVTIVKVGRKWLELDNGRKVCRNTLTARPRKGYESPGQCWRSKADYERWQRRHGAWRHFRRQVKDKWTAPDSVTLEQIQAAADLLRLAAYA